MRNKWKKPRGTAKAKLLQLASLCGLLLFIAGCGREEIIYGISFTNEVYKNPALPPQTHHTEESYRELKDMGINTVRFYLNYGIFEEDDNPYVYKESGFQWIEQNIDWAKKHGIRLILNMHYPQGGYQSNGMGSALWTEEENQKRFAALWEEIAKRYAKETTILGYGLLNEPVVPALETYEQSVMQWENLAQKACNSIRKEDGTHRIFVERLQGISGTEEAGWTFDYRDARNFIDLEDTNYTYEFHYYNPVELTHQEIAWYGSRSGYFYPGAGIWGSNSPVLKHSEVMQAENMNTQGEKESPHFSIQDNTVSLINITSNTPISRIMVKEYNEKGLEVRTYFENMDFTDNWKAAENGWKLQVKKGNLYQIIWLGDSDIKVDYYDGQYQSVVNREYIQEDIEYYLSIGERRGIPMYMGEMGTSAYSLENGLGGDIWLQDVLEIAAENQLGITIHCYHEAEGFGLYIDEAKDFPSTRNERMYEILTKASIHYHSSSASSDAPYSREE